MKVERIRGRRVKLVVTEAEPRVEEEGESFRAEVMTRFSDVENKLDSLKGQIDEVIGMLRGLNQGSEVDKI